MRHKVTKTYDKYKNETIEKQYRKQQRVYKKLKRKAKRNNEHFQTLDNTVTCKESTSKVQSQKIPWARQTQTHYSI